ncbi:diacylglycerol kinase [Pleomorphomonas oryzae]|uniref:diacylglycerol kinase n=1 Tax=Pleomorphomonas oryzae TaxID=261934 RepID=UPI000423BAA5|nr:diacylglycerol kinase [Pleomorphomonas oryzae]
MADVRAICAIGQRGQIGLNGTLPWEGNPGREFVADVERFYEVTRGHVMLAGPHTISTLPGFMQFDRTLCPVRSGDRPEDVLARFSDRVVYVAGGPAVWEAYAGFIRHWDINRLSYDGPADRWFKPEWLVATR